MKIEKKPSYGKIFFILGKISREETLNMIQRLSLRSQDIIVNFSQGHKKIAEYFLHLIPLFFISFIVSVNEKKISTTTIGKESLFELLLIVALISPWIAQASCLPIYVEAGKEIFMNGNHKTVQLHFYLIRKFFIFTLCLCFLISSTIFFSTNHSLLFSISVFCLCFFQVMFAQFMVLPLIQRDLKLWIIGWISYLLAFYFFIQFWYLPPLFGALSIFIKSGSWKELNSFKVPIYHYLLHFFCGLFMGLVLWIDKIILYLKNPETDISSYIFVSLIPSLLSLNFFYLFRLERIRESFKRTIYSINSESIKKYVRRRNFNFEIVIQSYIDLIFFLLFSSFITILIATKFLELNLNLIFWSHIFSFLMTILTVFLNNLLLLRAYGTFFKILFFIFLSITLFPLYQKANGYYLISVLSFLAITYIALKLTKSKWLNPHQVYLSF
jgi:hypothetical protein